MFFLIFVIKMEKFIRLNLENNASIYINPNYIVAVERKESSTNDKIKACVHTITDKHDVKQSVTDVNNLLNKILFSTPEP